MQFLKSVRSDRSLQWHGIHGIAGPLRQGAGGRLFQDLAVPSPNQWARQGAIA
ncbi:MAG: hypothetical protein KGL68_12265 [Burkholderiales bacterium]|nr:hypothetical protein [Burkholderiales bacterium]